MYFVFLDESGQAGGYDAEKRTLTNGSSKYFTLAGILIHSDNLLELERELKCRKVNHNLPLDKEFKWNAKYRKFNLSKDEYLSYRESIVELICMYENSVVASVINKEEAFKKPYINNHHDVYVRALHFIMERIEKELDERGHMQEPVMFMFDSRKNDKNSKLDEELQKSYIEAKNKGTYYMNFPNFLDIALFADSDYCAGVQLADYCAGIIQRKYELGYTDWKDKINTALRKSDTNVINGYGIKVFP